MISARSAADAEIDAAGKERGERAELFGDDQRRMIGEHDAAGADADGFCAAGDVRDDDGSGGAGDAGHVVVFCKPKAVVAPGFGVLREIERVAESVGGRGPLRNWGEVEDGERDHFLCAEDLMSCGWLGLFFGWRRERVTRSTLRALRKKEEKPKRTGLKAGHYKGKSTHCFMGYYARMKTIYCFGCLICVMALLPFRALAAADELTPLVVVPMNANTGVFMGTDARMHMVYELVLTNASGTPATLQKIEVVDAANTGKALASFEGAELLARLRTNGNSAAENVTIEFNGTRLFLIDLTIEATGRVPDRVLHHMELMGGGSPGPKPGTPVALKYDVAPVRVIQQIIRIGPPLAGKGWVAVNGCCAVNGVHRSTGLPVNGRIYFAQRFAIDWMQLDKDGRMVHGDASDVHNFTDYGAEILAVTDAKVVSTLDGLEDQKPGTLPDPATINLNNVDGNHVVLDIGEGLYAFYAHMQKGSVLVKPGDKVTRGQVLGKLGNTGNTSGPHLHFQVMGTPSPLGSNGVPYVLDLVTVEGQIAEAQYAAAPGVEGVWNQGMLPKVSERHGQFPMDLVIVGFGEK